MAARAQIADLVDATMAKAWLLRLALIGAAELPGEVTSEALIQGGLHPGV